MTSPSRRHPSRSSDPPAPQSAPARSPHPSTPTGMVVRHQPLPTGVRRFLAWSLEIGIFAASMIVPVHLGGQLNTWVIEPDTNMTAPVKGAQSTMARLLGISPRSLPTQVTPLTNVLWSTALALPILLASAHIYSIGRYGRSLPKHCLGLQVMTLEGQYPGWQRALLREGVGKCGVPVLVAYGFWRVSGAFPALSLLSGLTALALVGESLTGWGNRPRRSWHDYLAKTCVVDQGTGAIIRLSSWWAAEARASQRAPWLDVNGGLTSVVLNPGDRWLGIPSHLGLGLVILLLVGSVAGVGGHFLLGKATRATRSDETLYTNLVSTLTNPELDAEARRAAVLALGTLPDDRVTPLLVDLIAQTDDVLWLDALQQALVARRADAFPALKRLNQSLAADLAMQGDPALHRTLITRLQTVNRILTKLILLEGRDRPDPLILSRLHLGYLPDGQGEFRLVLQHQDLSGIDWQGSVLTQAQFQGSQFFHPGTDDHSDTYDDRTADFSGADLTDANLTGANLTLSRLVNTGLLRTTLNRANLTLATLNRANLEQARLIEANLTQAQLVEARFSNADLTQATLTDANLEAARLSEVNGAGIVLSGANLTGISAQAANLTDANLEGAILDNADLTGATLQGANLQATSLSSANLRDADLRGVWLQGANLANADFTGVILAEPTAIAGEDFVESVPALPEGDQFVGVDFSLVRNLDADQLTFICAQGGQHPSCPPVPTE